MRSGLGRFVRQAEAASPPDPAAPPDTPTAAASALRQAEQGLAGYQAEIDAFRMALHAAQEQRAAHLEAGEVDETLAAETEIRRAEIRWEIIGRRGAELSEAVDRAREAVRRQQWRELQPRLHSAYTSLHTTARELAQAIERVRDLDQQARNLGVAQVADTPEHRAINGYVLGQWIQQAQPQSQHAA
jgi:hypothetical protein